MLEREWEREIEDSLDIRIREVPRRLLGEYRANKRIIEGGERGGVKTHALRDLAIALRLEKKEKLK
jgi:hypothetical protein